MCDVLYVIDFGDGVIFFIDKIGVVFYWVVVLMSYKYIYCEVIFGVSYLFFE